MPTVFTKGDLFGTAGIDAYAIGVSAAGTMDAGTAVAFRKKWPGFFDGYKAACGQGLHAGDVYAWRGDDALVYALVLSPNEATSPRLPAFMGALGRMLELAQAANVEKLAMPRVGTKTARTQVGQGLDWTRVKKVLSEIGDATPVTMVVIEQFIRGKDALEGIAIPELAAANATNADEEDATGEPLEAIADNDGEATTPTRRAKAKAKKKKAAGKSRSASPPKTKASTPRKTSAPKKTSAKKKATGAKARPAPKKGAKTSGKRASR